MRIMSLAVAAATITWGLIVIVQYRFRKQVDVKALSFKVPFYPFSNYFALAFLALLLVMMTQSGNMIYAVIVMPIWIIALYIGFLIKKAVAKRR